MNQPRPSLRLAPEATEPDPWSAEHAAQLRAAVRAWRRRDPAADPAEQLYRRWYAAGPDAVDAVDARDDPETAWHPWWPPVPRVLRAAHAGSRSWTAPTTVVAVGLAGTVVTRDAAGVARAHPRGDYLSADADVEPGHEPTVGASVRTLARGGAHVADGWWRTWGGGWRSSTTTVPDGISRIYLAARPDRVTTLVRRLTAALADRGHPWQVKLGADPLTLSRADGAVVYLPDAARPVMAEVLVTLAGGLVADRRPPLTCPIAPGVAWAHDPGTGDSFGESRCAVVAEGLAAAQDDGDPLAAVADAFVRHGLDPAAPHLRASR